jgi:ribonuclease BN (tRNA processing enzyme)
VQVTLWGTRGSLAAPGPDTARYGGNTSCVGVRGREGTIVVLDAGTGIRRLGATIDASVKRVDILLTHLHMDHIQGLGFFGPLYRPDLEVHMWGPAFAHSSLHARLRRYLSPPLFPVGIRELPCRLKLHDLDYRDAEIGEFRVAAARVCHPGPTVGYRLTDRAGCVLTYLPDHEPALGAGSFPSLAPEWISGASLSEGSDLLIHDSQYAAHEYPRHVGWGHSSISDVLAFADLVGVKHLVPFHHDPGRSDADLDRLMAAAIDEARPAYQVTPAREGMTFDLSRGQPFGAAARQ